MDVGADLDERIGQVRAHEAVGARDEHGAAGVGVAELATQVGEGVLGPDRVGLIRNTLARVASLAPAAPRSILSSGLLTALSIAVVTGLSAAVGVVIARKFGRGVETDGFFAAYGVFLVLVLAASAVRVAVLPSLGAGPRRTARSGASSPPTRSRSRSSRCRRSCSASLASDWTADQLAGGLPPNAQETAADALVFLVPAAVAHLYAALAASGLAAFDSYAHRRRRLRARQHPRPGA